MPGLAAKVRAKFPGAYDDIADADLERQVLAKHPEYADLATPAAPPQAAPQMRSRTGALYTPPSESGVGDMAQGFGDALNPMGYLRAASGLMTNPGETVKQLALSPVRLAGELVTNPAHAIGSLAGMLVGGKALGAVGDMPAGRLLSAGTAGAKAAAGKLPIVGPPLKAGAQAAMQSWRDTAPAVAESTPAAAPVASAAPAAAPLSETPVGPMPKPKLSATEVAQRLRTEYGSDRAGMMLYGKKQPGMNIISPAERQAAIKRLAPGESQLPNAAKQSIASQYGKFQEYLAQAPNQRARDYILSLMKGGE